MSLSLSRLLPVLLLAFALPVAAAQVVPWGVDMVRAREVWPVTRGEGVNVVIMDSGVDFAHPDLHDAYAGGTDPLFGDEFPLDFDSHGTPAAGIVAGADNGFGIVGVAPRATLWAVKVTVLSPDPLGRTVAQGDSVLRGIDWVIAKKRELGGRWIVNCSFGVPNSPQFADAYARMIAEGILVVAAAGNHERGQSPIVLYPANFPDVLGVGAVDQRRQLAPFSNPGPKISVVAPGRNVVSTYSRDQGDVPSVSANGKIWYGIRVLGYYAPEVRTGEGVLVDCGIGRPEDFPQDKSGYTAVIRSSSTLTLNRIGHNAVAAGAGTIVFIYSDFEPQRWTFQSADDPNAKSFPWPLTVALNEDDGYELSQSIGAQAALDDRFGDYGVTSGTSFASPHVAGVAALLWSLAPNATAAELRKAITATAHDMGTPGWDEATGYGLVDAAAAARYLAPEKFPLSGRRVLKH